MYCAKITVCILEKMSSVDTSDVIPPIKCVSRLTNQARLRRAKICQLISLPFYKENMMNMMNCTLYLTSLTFQNHLNQHQCLYGLVIHTLWHITSEREREREWLPSIVKFSCTSKNKVHDTKMKMPKNCVFVEMRTNLVTILC